MEQLNALRGRLMPRFLILAVAAVLATMTPIPLSAAGVQKRFATPEEATAALVAGAKTGDDKALLDLLGPEAKPLIDSGDPVADQAGRERFVAAYEESHTLEKAEDGKAVLRIGKDNWQSPIPLVKDEAGWRFDTAAGQDEILSRRIGRNERSAIQAALAYVDAQRDYYVRNPQGGALLHYAQKITSSRGMRDGLYWETAEDEMPSPLGPVFASGRAAGYAGKTGTAPYHGYYYRILTAQGPDAPGGAYDYVVRGKMIGGFALVAHPAEYGSSGVMTFLVNHDGTVLEKDLGLETAKVAKAMTKFNPDATWKRVEDADDIPAE